MKLIKLKILILVYFFWGCAGHSTISPKILKKDKRTNQLLILLKV